MRILAALLLASALLAGCSGSSEAPAADLPVHPLAGVGNITVLPDGALELDLTADGCVEGILLMAIEPSHARSLLPDGFEPADLQAVFGTPFPTGRSGAWLNAYTCDGTTGKVDGAEFGIVVTQPSIQNGTVEPAGLHIYQFAQMTSSPEFAAVLHHIGVPHLDASIQVTGGPQAGPLAEDRFTVEHPRTSHVFTTVTAETGPLSNTANFYTLTEGGLAYAHFVLTDIPVAQGIATACRLSGLSAELADRTDCPPGTGFTLSIPEQAWTATYRFLPGATA